MTISKPEISVAIIARNAAATIEKCLVSVNRISDDLIVILDPRTTDQTASVCRKFGARVYTRRFDNFSSQKNYALSHTKYPWVLSLDADEWLGPELQRELLNLSFVSNITAYSLPRRNIIFGRTINHTNWDPDGLVRLFNKTKSVWQGQVHEQIVTRGAVSRLSSPILHQNYQTVTDFMSRQDNYSTLEAEEKIRLVQKFNLYSALTQPLFEFFRRYIWHAGFLDGWHGLFLSYLMSIYHLSVWVKLWQKSKATSV